MKLGVFSAKEFSSGFLDKGAASLNTRVWHSNML